MDYSRTVLRVPLPCPVTFVVLAIGGPALRLRIITKDGRFSTLFWDDKLEDDQWGVVRITTFSTKPFRMALDLAVARLGERVDPGTLDLVCSWLSDPGAFWEALSVLES